MRVGLKRLIIILCVGVGTTAAFPATPEETQSELTTVQQNLQQSTAHVQELKASIAEALKAQDEISSKLVVLGSKLREQEASLSAADERIQILETQSVTLASDLASKQDELSVLLAGLMRLQQNPPPALAVDPEDVLKALRGAMMFGAVVPEFQHKAQDLKAKLDALTTIRHSTEAEKSNQKAALAALSDSNAELIALQLQKKSALASAKQNLAAEKLNVTALADKSQTLQQLLTELQRARDDEERRKSAEAKLAAEAATTAEAARLAALQGPLKLLSSLKGKLPYPVQGSIIRHYGDETGLGTTLEGVAFDARPLANVMAPVDGKVEFAGPFRSYGQLLILNAGEGYLVLLAGMKQISAELGQTVRIGEPIGVMGVEPTAPSLLGEMPNQSHPVFYVEFRKKDQPVDPTPWWDEGKREAMR